MTSTKTMTVKGIRSLSHPKTTTTTITATVTATAAATAAAAAATTTTTTTATKHTLQKVSQQTYNNISNFV